MHASSPTALTLARAAAQWQRWVAALVDRRGPLAALRPAGPELFTPAALATHWRDAVRETSARLLLASARERLLDSDDHGDAITLRLGSQPPLHLPLRRRGPFDLHRVALDAQLDPRMDDPLASLAVVHAAAKLDGPAGVRLHAELLDSIVNLAQARLATALRHRLATQLDPAPRSDLRFTDPEHFVTDGHPWHVMTRVRLGLHRAEVLRYAAELLAHTPVGCVEVAEDIARVSGDYVERSAPWLGPAAPGYVRVPIHPAGIRRLPRVFPELFASARIRPVPGVTVATRSLLSLRTVAVDARTHLKLACPVHTTSTRRVVSPMSVRNGPIVSALLARIQARDPQTASLRLLPEPAGAGLEPRRVGPRAAELGAIFRALPEHEGDAWVCAALGERWPGSTERVIERACAGYPGGPSERAAALIQDWLAALLPASLRLLSRYGVVLELHTQNTLVRVEAGRFAELWVRDLGGIRLHGPRLARAGLYPSLAENSFILSSDLAEVRGKLEHTLFHAHLSTLFEAAETLGFDPRRGWAMVRALMQRCYRRWADEEHADARLHADAREDLGALRAPKVRAKALLRMRLTESSSDYEYTVVPNKIADT